MSNSGTVSPHLLSASPADAGVIFVCLLQTSNMQERDTSRDSHGCQVLMGTLGIIALGPVGAIGAWYLGKRMDKWVNENRDQYDPA